MSGVMIVDDEYLQRELVKASICWEQLDLELVGEACDGKSALTLFEKYHPDIVIMDINIPFINGIEVAEIIKKKAPKTQILMLTAYGEFDYARDALNLGAIAFVLKPLNPVELQDKLLLAGNNIRNTEKQRKELWESKRDKMQLEREQFLLEIMTGLVNREKLSEKCEKFGLRFGPNICVLDIRFSCEKVRKEMQEEIEEYVREQLDVCEPIPVEKDILLLLSGEETEEEMQVKIYSLCNSLNESGEEWDDVTGGFSGIYQGMEKLPTAYREAWLALNRPGKPEETGDKRMKFRRYETQDLSLLIRNLSYRPEEILRLIRSSNQEDLFRRVTDIFEKLDRDNYAQESALYIAMDILVNVTSYLMECGIEIIRELEHEHVLIAGLSNSGTKEDIKDAIIDFLKKGLSLLEQQTLTAGNRKAKEAKKFIEENYYLCDLSLNTVALEVGVNPSYLSNLFKKEFQFSLSRYMIKVRLENAVAYMKERPEATLSEVALEVGYTDVYYFSKSFKNYYGLSPSKFMEERK